MAAETVLIEVQPDKIPGSLGRARVTADFTMRNLGSTSENMAVRFPISADNGFEKYPEIANLVIKVNGKQISFQRASYPDIRYQMQDVPWAEFNVTFPVGQDTVIQVAYNLDGSGYAPLTAFYYILRTGAGWKDTIGSADITLRLPYEASPQNVIMDLQIGWAETTPGGVFQGNEVRWHFDDFEPGPDGPVQDMEFGMVSPVAWQTVLKERDNVANSPDDGEAWGRLGKAYKEIFLMNRGYRSDAGGQELYKLSIEAYQKCLALKPDDAQWHAGFADLLANRSYWDSWMNGPTADTYRAFDEIRAALRLAPKDAKVLAVAETIQSMFPDGMTRAGTGYDFPWLTQTPTPIPPTATIVPVLDPAAVSGLYQSDMLTLGNNKKAQLTLTLRPDHSAETESKYENDPPTVSIGSWMDNGDGTLSIAVTDPNKKRFEIKFIIKNDLLQANEYPAFYGDAGITMTRLIPATPVPAATDTPQPTPGQPAPALTSKPSLPCGSAALALLAAVLWLAYRRR